MDAPKHQRHRHRYEFNDYRKQMEEAGMKIADFADKRLVEI